MLIGWWYGFGATRAATVAVGRVHVRKKNHQTSCFLNNISAVEGKMRLCVGGHFALDTVTCVLLALTRLSNHKSNSTHVRFVIDSQHGGG